MKQVSFITTCSRNKIMGGEDYKRWKYTGSAGSKLLEARKSLFDRLRLQQSGLVKGKDFGGNDSGSYLPSWLRYSRGAFMGSLQECLRELWFVDAKHVHQEGSAIDLWLNEYPLLFISGLYGVVPALEPIQDYDVRLEGVTEDFWGNNKELIARELALHLDRARPEDTLILDSCGSSEYSKLIDWNYLNGRGFQVRHAVSSLLEGGQVRAETGRMAASLKPGVNTESLSALGLDIKFVDTSNFLKCLEHHTAFRQQTIVGVACLNGNQQTNFMKFVEKQGWTAHFSFLYSVGKLIPDDWHKRGVRQIIAHVDNTHAEVCSTYGDLSKYQEVIKLRKGIYSSLELRLHYRSE